MSQTVWLLWNGRDDPGYVPTLVGVYEDRETLHEDAMAIRRHDRRARLTSMAEHVKGATG